MVIDPETQKTDAPAEAEKPLVIFENRLLLTFLVTAILVATGFSLWSFWP